jgi:hypothetical protein
MKKMEYKKVIPAAIIIIALIYFIGQRAGVKAGKRKGRVVADYDPDSISPNFSADAMALKVYNAFKGWNLFDNGRAAVLEDLKRLSNGELAATYNTFNEKFVDPPDSMTSVIKSDFIGLFASLQNSVVERLERLNLT